MKTDPIAKMDRLVRGLVALITIIQVCILIRELHNKAVTLNHVVMFMEFLGAIISCQVVILVLSLNQLSNDLDTLKSEMTQLTTKVELLITKGCDFV